MTLPAALVEAVRGCDPGGIAAFDADGTLWREDVGEAFLRHLVSIGWVKLPDGRDPYAEYERRVGEDRRSGYVFAAQLQAGLRVDDVQGEAERFAREWVPPRLIPQVNELRALCDRQRLKTVIVSASPLPIVLAAAKALRIPSSHCTGIEVEVTGGRFTDKAIEPVTYAAGKVAALERRGWSLPTIACGDSAQGDAALLSAARIGVVVAPRSGSPFSAMAPERGWFVVERD
ncbi:MAG TPA: haloacid dehalogenase-like hydrolase [Myxococcales bacterium]|nr:haloacid dehalogenase-like hydrolase [Myxococcales bacterium]